MQTQDNTPMCYREEIEELGEKPLRRPPSGNQSTRQSVGIHGLVIDPPSLIFQAPTPTRLLKTVSCLALRIPQYARLHLPKPGFFQCLLAVPKPH